MPPGIKKDWDENDVWAQANLIAYEQIRDYEQQEKDLEVLKASVGSLRR